LEGSIRRMNGTEKLHFRDGCRGNHNGVSFV
jgi:hypothetical protein